MDTNNTFLAVSYSPTATNYPPSIDSCRRLRGLLFDLALEGRRFMDESFGLPDQGDAIRMALRESCQLKPTGDPFGLAKGDLWTFEIEK